MVLFIVGYSISTRSVQFNLIPLPLNTSKFWVLFMEKVTITVEALVNAPIQEVWDAWTNSSRITRWNFANDEWECPSASNDLREGGTFTSRMAAKDGSAGFDFGGTYTKVDLYKCIEYDLEDNRHVCVEFIPIEDTVKIVETFEPEKENSEKIQRSGWQAILNNFKKYVENK